MTIRLPKRPTAAAVEDAMTTAGFGTSDLSVLSAEIVHLRECIERCKAVQRVNEEAAKELQLNMSPDDDHMAKIIGRQRLMVYREVSTELAKALEGF